jgi:hypothetical protein
MARHKSKMDQCAGTMARHKSKMVLCAGTRHGTTLKIRVCQTSAWAILIFGLLIELHRSKAIFGLLLE